MGTYGKAIIGFLYFVAAAVIPQISGDGRLDLPELIGALVAFATAAGVWLVPLVPQWPVAKTAVGALLAGLNVAVTLVSDHTLDLEEGLMIGAAVIAALGIWRAPAASPLTGTAVPWGPDRRQVLAR